MMRIKKFLTILMTVAMVVSLLPATAFAANNTATTMRLAKTQGKVTVTSNTGKNVKQTGNMKLYNGYKVKTGAKSYAWISLDDTKVAKLDANSSVEVQKSGKALTLYLSSGNLFFNVKKPLSGGETFNIKTSTMTTGIRGTSGCVRVINDRVTEIHLLTGQVQVYTEHPALGVSKTAVLQAGQKATSLIDWEAMQVSGEQAEIVIERLENHEVCGICSKEIAEDPALLERIEAEAPHLLPEKAAAEADERLAADEAKAEEKQKAIEEAVAEQTFPEDVDPYFEKEASSGGGGGGGGSSSGGSSAVTEENTVYKWDELIEKINEFNAGTENMTITLGENLPNADDMVNNTAAKILPAVNNNGKTLTLNLSNYMLALEDTWVNNGDLVITNNDGMIGEYTDPDPFFFVFENNGTLTLERGTIAVYSQGGAVANNDGAVFIMEGGIITPGEITFDSSNELVFTADAFDYTTGIQNYNGYVEIRGGLIETSSGINDFSSSVASGMNSVKITGGTFAPIVGSTGDSTGVYSEGNLEMTGGTINLTAPNAYGVMSAGNAALSGGNISVGAGATGATGVESSGTLTMNGSIKVVADAGQAVRAGGNVTLDSGADIRAYDAAKAVVLGGGDDTVNLTRPVRAFIAAEAQANVINTLYTEMLLAQMTDEEGNGMYVLTDGYADDGINTAEELAAAIEAFNTGSGDATITLTGDIDMTAATVSLPAIGGTADTKVLTLHLNSNALHLKEQLTNNGNLIIKDNYASNGVLSGAAATLIYNAGDLQLTGGTLSAAAANTTAVYVADGSTATMDGMNISLQNVDGATAVYVADGGSFEAKSKNITFASPSANSVGIYVEAGAEATLSGTYIQSSSTGNEGLKMVSLEGRAGTATTPEKAATLNMTDGLLRDADNGYAIYSDYGVVNISGGTLTTAGTPGYIIYAVNSTVNVTGGELEPVSSGTSGTNYGIYLVGSELNYDGGIMEAGAENSLYNFQPVYADSTSEVNLISGTIIARTLDTLDMISIAAEDDLTLGSGMVVKRYQSDDILNIRGTDTGLFEAEGPDSDGYYALKEASNTNEPEGITTWAQLAAAVDEFNAQDGNGQTVTLKLGANIPAASETNLVTMNPISSGNKRLVIDLNNRSLTLPQKITVYGNLEIVGGGMIDSTLTSTGTYLFDVASTGSITLDANTSGGTPTIDLKQGQTAINSTQSSVYMYAGKILLDETPATGIYSNGGKVYMTGGEIVLAAYDNTLANIGIQAANRAEVNVLGDGTIREDIQSAVTEEDDNIAIYANGATVNLYGNAVVSVHNGNAVRVAAASDLTLQENSLVEGKDNAKVLVTNDQSMGKYTVKANTGKTGYYILTKVTLVGDETAFANALQRVDNGENVSIQLTNNITLTSEYAIGGGTTTGGVLNIDMNGKNLILSIPDGFGVYVPALMNYETLHISGSGTISAPSSSTSTDLIENNGTMTWKDAELVLQDGQTGIFNFGTLTMTSGSIIAPATTVYATYGVLYQAVAAGTTTVSDAVTLTGSATKVAQAQD